jgi:hypothetical protein
LTKACNDEVMNMIDQVAAYLDGCSVYSNSAGCILTMWYGISNNKVTTGVVDE